MTDDTAAAIRELLIGVQESSDHLLEAARAFGESSDISNSLWVIAKDRQRINENVGDVLQTKCLTPLSDCRFLRELRTVWNAIEAEIRRKDPAAILSEVSRAERFITDKFLDLLPQIAGSSIHDMLLKYFQRFCEGQILVSGLKADVAGLQ